MTIENYLDIYENPFNIISNHNKNLKEIMNDCIYILDTNILLLPYTVGSKELGSIESLYSDLLEENRLYIPEQVLKEFAKNRPNKLCEMYKSIADYLSSIAIMNIPQYKLIAETKEYQDAISSYNACDAALKQYKMDIKNVLNFIQELNWDDPVSLLYSKLFKESSIVSYHYDYNELQKELANRHQFNLPPAYKDKGKDDKGIGDYIIWKTILETGLRLDSDIVFITGDEKADWFHQANSSKLYPRYELIYEFCQYTKGHHISFTNLSTLMEKYQVNNSSIEFIKDVEKVELHKHSRANIQMLGHSKYEKVNGRCEKCGTDISPDIAQVHFIKPLSEGGECTIDNCVILCPNCHAHYNSGDFIAGSPCQMSGQKCPACHIGIMDATDDGVVCNKCGLRITI